MLDPKAISWCHTAGCPISGVVDFVSAATDSDAAAAGGIPEETPPPAHRAGNPHGCRDQGRVLHIVVIRGRAEGPSGRRESGRVPRQRLDPEFRAGRPGQQQIDHAAARPQEEDQHSTSSSNGQEAGQAEQQ